MPKKFLIIQTAFLGDVVLATPLIEKLRQAFPDAVIDFLVRKGNESLLRGHPFLRQVLVFDKKKKANSMRALIGQMRRERYDLVVNTHRFASSGVMAVLSGAKAVHGFAKNPLSWVYTRRFPHVIGQSHEVDRNLSLLSGFTDTGFTPPRLYPPSAAYDQIPEGDYVCMAPTSVWFTKQWPEEKWIALIDRIPSRVKVVLLGGPADREACERICRKARHPGAYNMAGKLSLLESAAWMQRARMNYANDSAPIHLASAMDAPVTAIFCSTVPAFGFTPLSPGAQVFETEEKLSCRPCGLHGYKACPEGHFRCAEIAIDRLEPERVGA
ncbi:MAG: glycosyltransferase family 9 protein [Haliscomenobacter sp.]|nr:glycosyltransferase family 9 protein [Haliscomenobacter sp.]MBK8880209.1 glycosyltransferase family 9 protein [Haliscomenobacter sp.]